MAKAKKAAAKFESKARSGTCGTTKCDGCGFLLEAHGAGAACPPKPVADPVAEPTKRLVLFDAVASFRLLAMLEEDSREVIDAMGLDFYQHVTEALSKSEPLVDSADIPTRSSREFVQSVNTRLPSIRRRMAKLHEQVQVHEQDANECATKGKPNWGIAGDLAHYDDELGQLVGEIG